MVKSRKTNVAGKRFHRWFSIAAKKRVAHRLQFAEQLERRQLMTADFSDAVKGVMGSMFFTDQTAYESTAVRVQQRLSSGGGGGGEGVSNNSFTTTEAEPNNTRFQSNFLPLGTAPGKSDEVIVGGQIASRFDEDFFSFDLRKGDIIDVRVQAQLGLLPWTAGLYTSVNEELVFVEGQLNTPNVPGRPPSINPTMTDGSANFSYVIDEDGRYFLRVGEGSGVYTTTLRTYRPTIEKEAIGNSQIIFLDFDGALLPREAVNVDLITGIGGTMRVPPLRNDLPLLGLAPSDEGRLIDEIVRRVTDKLQTKIKQTANNGFFPNSGIPGEFNVIVLNSKDHPDPWGQKNVSRLVFGGTQLQLLGSDIGLLGIAQSIDVGNFDREESALVMTDILVQGATADLVYSGSSTILEGFAELSSMVLAHEAGHYLGGWHQDPTNQIFHIMDQFYDPLISSGSGPDQIFGTTDDLPLRFGEDNYSPLNPGIPNTGSGVVNSDNVLAFGMSTGKQGGTVTGTIWNDKNRNGRIDTGEPGLEGWTIFADLNGDGIRNITEQQTTSGTNGRYTLTASAGTILIKAALQPGWQATNPSNGVQSVVVAVDQIKDGINFGFVNPTPTATGFKWNDLNGDGIRDQGEPPLEGIWIYLDLDGDKRLDIGEPADKTKLDGSYRITPPSAGTYTVREVLDPGYVQTFPASGEHVVSYDGSTFLVGLDFGNQVALDWGDAPRTYPVLAVNNGAVHGFVNGLSLGTKIDTEANGVPSTTALGDDNRGPVDANNVVIDDEDGILFLRPIVAGDTKNAINATVTNTTGVTTYLHAWIDFNADGDWSDAGEQILKNVVVRNGSNVLNFTAPAGAIIGDTFARFRLSQEFNTAIGGRARSGEVEDYKVAVVDKLVLARNDEVTVSRNSINNQIDVLANDFKLPNETLRVVSVSQGTNGGRISIVTGGGKVQYTPVNGFVGTDTFTYTMRNAAGVNSTATVTVNVALVFDKPVAVDDSFDVVVNSIGIPLNVLSNDIEGRPGPLQIVSVSSPDQGGAAVIGAGNQSLRYTPARNFGGTETFSYSAVDSAGNVTTATVTVHVLPGDRTDDVVDFSFKFVDANGNVMLNPRVRQGEQFGLQVFVDDLRGPATVFPGVYAAYLDLLYNAYLVSPSTPAVPGEFNFDVTFANFYTAFKKGSAEIPGVIDDLGAFDSRTDVPDRPDPVLFATLKFNAVAPGLATFAGDPADKSPFTDVLLSNSPNTPVATRQIRYGRASIEVVGDGVEFPQAVDDSVSPPVAVNSANNIINVLKNDSAGSTKVIRLSSVSAPMHGTAFINTNGTTSPADDYITYTPDANFRGKDQFTYTIRDGRGFASTGTVTVPVGVQSGDVTLQLTVTDTNGTPIEQVEVGKKFQLRGFIQDTRASATAKGVFAAFQDILYDSEFVTIDTSATNPLGFQASFGANYDKIPSGDIVTKNVINELGSVQDIQDVPESQKGPLGGGRFLQFVITMTAKKVTTVDTKFVGDPADVRPFHDTLLFEPPTPVSFERIVYTADNLKIVAPTGGSGGGEGFHNFANPFDVNGDGNVSPIDVLGIINQLNKGGVQNLSGGGGGGEGELTKKLFIDVNNDGMISPIDALGVINRLNQLQSGGGGGGEGEGEAADIANLACGALSHLRSSQGLSSQLVASQNAVVSQSQVGQSVYGPVAPQQSSNVADRGIASFSASESEVDDVIASLAADVLSEWASDLN